MNPATLARRATSLAAASLPLLAALACLAPTARAARVDDAPMITTQKLRWQTAQALAAEAVRICAADGYSVTATVVDPSGHAQAVVKGDTVPLQSLSVSYRKAYTAFSYGMTFNLDTTSQLIAAKVTGPLDGAVLATEPEVLFIPGGVTLRRADRGVIGGIGVSGAPGGDKNEACAQAAVAKYQDRFR